MNLNLLEPNASYDLVHGRPSTFQRDNDGSYLYRYNIAPQMRVPEGGDEETQVGWQCREIRIWEKPTKSTLKKAIIRSILDDSAEFDIINSYNKHTLKIKVDNAAVTAYIQYLQFTEDLDDMLVVDFENFNL